MRKSHKSSSGKKKLKWWQILICILIIIGAIGSCTGSKNQDEDEPVSTVEESIRETSEPEATQTVLEDTAAPSETPTANPLLQYGEPDFFDVMNGAGTEIVSTRAYMTAEKEPFASADGFELEEFCDTVAVPALNAASWFTVDFGDGTGLFFSAGLPKSPTYCYIDEQGANVGSIIYYTIENGTITTEYPEKDDEEESEAEEDSHSVEQAPVPTEEMVWIASSGNGTRYHKSSSCSNMDDPIQIPISEAQARGYTACQKNSCYG